jgi:hypothetical protein
MMSISRVVLWVCVVASIASPAFAQSWSERVHVSINGAFQPTSNDFSDRFEFERYLETGSTDVDYPIEGGFVFDAGAGVRLWKNLGAGVSVSYFTRSDTASTTTSVPHPFFFNRPRTVTGDATDLTRKETVAHVQAMYLVNPGGRLRMIFSGGPSFFSVEQDMVSEVVITETFPFDEAAFGSARREQAKGSKTAFNVGADVLFMLSSKFGVGGIVRFSRASVDLDGPGDRTIAVDAGGVYAGGGVRLLF